jgi:hypothetical protein
MMALFGTNGFTPEHSEAIKNLPELNEVILFFYVVNQIFRVLFLKNIQNNSIPLFL